ncbi:uncharacterized protein N7529_001832 [Penicillium soppii]|uniref:uncharacterized protein n=1 Tax=Penicillium soppii TaxID=69789 RepID=UPI0025492B32|nr:uncharacterized protein N7529_001832 [Penicillium soppii]KAJ5876248.1 hypothetical protein N7529_001832 [Penicillium soppii]
MHNDPTILPNAARSIPRVDPESPARIQLHILHMHQHHPVWASIGEPDGDVAAGRDRGVPNEDRLASFLIVAGSSGVWVLADSQAEVPASRDVQVVEVADVRADTAGRFRGRGADLDAFGVDGADVGAGVCSAWVLGVGLAFCEGEEVLAEGVGDGEGRQGREKDADELELHCG